MAIELTLPDHVHQLNAGNENACAAKGLESGHGPHDALDGPVVFHDVVQVFALTQFDVCSGVFIGALNGSRACRAAGRPTVRLEVDAIRSLTGQVFSTPIERSRVTD